MLQKPYSLLTKTDLKNMNIDTVDQIMNKVKDGYSFYNSK